MPVRLKALELHGFKSFADPIRLEFPGPVTAIVGPNGSGKSNIAEAIRWVLGEQSLSTLRARRGEDLIFAGGDQRPRAGMAEVTLIFDNSDGELSVEFEEVALTRRVYRDGEGEYLLNGNRVRLRDIQELLGSTPLARRTYTVIGQGVVDEVLRMRPEERRALFEEAAGIALYRMKREEALRRLEITRQNLMRARDLLAEMTPRLSSLRRQAERARQYEELLSQLKRRWRQWAARRMARLRQGLEAARAALAEAEAARLRHQEQQAMAEQQALTLREEIRRQRAALAEQEAAWAKLQEESAAVQRQLQAVEEALQALSEQARARRAQAEALRAREATLRAMEEALKTERKALEDRLRALHEQRRALEALYAPKRMRHEALCHQRAEVQTELHRLEEEEAHLARRRVALQSLQRELEEQSLQRAALRERWMREQADWLREQEQLLEEARVLEATLEAMERQRAQISRQLEEAEAGVLQAQEQAAQARARKAYLEAYAESLARSRETQEGLRGDLRAILAAGLPGVLGSLADFLEIEHGWEAAVAAMLGPLLQALVVRDPATMERVRSMIHHGLPVVILGGLRVKRSRPVRSRSSIGGIALPARRFIPPARPARSVLRAREPRLQAWLERRLEDVWLVETWEQALRLWPQLPRTVQIMTRDGERISGEGVLWIGEYAAPEVVWLTQEQAWRSLPEQIRAAQETLRRAEEAMEASSLKWRQLQEERASLEAIYRSAEARREEVRRRLRDIEEAIRKATIALQALEQEISEGKRRQAQIEAEQQELDRLGQALAQKRRALEESRSMIDSEIINLGLEPIEAERARLQTEERMLEEQCRQVEEMLARHQEALQAIEAERAALSLEEADEQRAVLEAERERWQDRQRALAIQLRELETRRVQGMAALLTTESMFEEAWKQVESLREAGQALEEQVHAAQLEVVRWEGEVHAFRQVLREEWRYLDEGEMDSEMETAGEEEAEPLEALEAEVEALRRALRRLGPIHPEAASEYAALQERHAFLTSQIADLEAAAASLQQTIAALDQQMQQAFMATFRAVGRAFKETFIELFGGGNARLMLTEAESWDQAGVEIFVRVPGKRTQSLMMLSGGEKALTATALIFALLKVRPSPFVVLDEADAALDEANIGRFREMIRRLSERTQFILITHNRGTIEAADTIYGVTMRSDGVSQVLSLRLEEGERILPGSAS
ncbi:MAG: chromosome segregation protein SMC [Thermoflexus sp.]|uniref:chromosome segregation protein SMC n=1 Tax=Thermoflexus sp. TaxID=1969742 RepID=UPI0025D33104|nr:chromosome segregation protein SMC [Thermoflexus sp.]MCS6963198.1 chromosome segregation protein SMC [Thermoflexus sp.]MDW8184457.1 chromosome segregation protein SMC [Anaerolineae bacterium]